MKNRRKHHNKRLVIVRPSQNELQRPTDKLHYVRMNFCRHLICIKHYQIRYFSIERPAKKHDSRRTNKKQLPLISARSHVTSVARTTFGTSIMRLNAGDAVNFRRERWRHRTMLRCYVNALKYIYIYISSQRERNVTQTRRLAAAQRPHRVRMDATARSVTMLMLCRI